MKLSKFAVALIAATVGFSSAVADETKFGGESLKLIIANDLGRNGYFEQKQIAEVMGNVAAMTGPEAVLALGDTHHYGGVQSVSDPLWMTNYELIYSHPELMLNWYPVCGNHEYRGNSQAVVDYSDVSRRWVMPDRYYSKVFTDDGISVRVVFLDTTPLIGKYRLKSDTYPDASAQDAEAQLQWLDRTLAEATEDWVIVAGHHPIYAYTDKDESERTDMQAKVDPILRKHRVDMYVCGHIHNFQHIRKSDSLIDYVVNSSGSLSREPGAIDGTVFCSGAAGFSLISATPESLTLYMIDADGDVVHTVNRKK